MSFEIPKAKINGLKLKLKQGLVQISNATKVAAIKNESILKLKLGEIDLAKLISIMKVKKPNYRLIFI
jgi:hypothetical protein